MSSVGSSLDLDKYLQKTGQHYVAIGEHADLWDGQLTNPGSAAHRVAIKVLRGGTLNKPYFLENLKRTLEEHGRTWKTFEHMNVARFYGLAFNCGIMPALILDFCPNGNINEYVKRHSLGNDSKLSLIKEVAQGMKYLHEFQPHIIHGDIRGANILIDQNGHPVLTDYELVFIIDSSDFTTTKIMGTCRWAAPELMQPPQEGEEEQGPQYTLQSDVFAFAMTMIEVFTEDIPFAAKKTDGAVLFAILDDKRPQVPPYIEGKPEVKELLENSWHSRPEVRPTAHQICTTLGPESQTISARLTGWGSYLINPVGRLLRRVWR